MASAAVMAQATDRQLVVLWRPDHHCEAHISDVLDYEGPVISADVCDGLRARSEHIYNYMEIEEGSVFQEPILANESSHYGDVFVRSAYTLVGPLFDRTAEDLFLRGLRPSKSVADLVRSVEHPSDVAVHIRMATGPAFDHLSYESPENWPPERHLELMEWRQKSDIARFVTRLDALFASGEAQTVFAAADLPATYAALIERYGKRVRYLKRTEYDRSSSQLQTGLADMMLLTASRLFLASNWSSFSDVAQRLAGPHRVFEQSGVDF
ncbi:hypothetical protein GGR95_003555 [Sulfitobacter undariae]|uniref:Uncharacterized protein n=1 Tax=Sulfitobacter undariae TaxID=1563671 RepID=A0A7W6E804_9RHOB|nr:hypothetical protein [Sulfitobacter undariae]MBB3995889.1 hypothetical protein [Sulfitobacter undariae]